MIIYVFQLYLHLTIPYSIEQYIIIMDKNIMVNKYQMRFIKVL